MSLREDYKAYVDDELAPSLRAAVEREIESNPESAKEVMQLQLITNTLRACAPQPVPDGLQRTLVLLQGRPAKRFFTGRVGLALAAVAAASVIGALFFPVFAQSKEAASAVASNVRSREEHSSAAAPAASSPSEARRSGSNAKSFARGDQSADDSTLAKSGTPPYNAPTDAPPLPNGFRPLMIRTGQLDVEVENVARAQARAENVAMELGGMVQDSRRDTSAENLGTASVTLRVPESRFGFAMSRLRDLGRVKSEGMQGQDVTTQVADTEARLRVMRAEEDQYITILKSTRRVGEILSVKERLSQVREQIESLDAQKKSLRGQANYSTISLTLEEKSAIDKPKRDEGWLDSTWSTAVNALSATGRVLGSALVYVLVFSPVWLPIVLLALWQGRRNRR